MVASSNDSYSNIYWNDILKLFWKIEDQYTDNVDFSVLLMSIKTGVLGTERNFYTSIDDIELEIIYGDSEDVMKSKLFDFINGLIEKSKEKKSGKVENEVTERAKQAQEIIKGPDKELEKTLKEKESEIDDLRRKLANAQNQAQVRQKPVIPPSYSQSPNRASSYSRASSENNNSGEN